MAVATWIQVAVALGRPPASFNTDQQAQITWWLDGAELLIKNRLGDVSLLDQASLKYVEVEAAAEKSRRHLIPETSITTTVDDGSVTRRYEYPVTDSDITDAWWALLSPVAETGAFTIRPAAVCRRVPDAEWDCP